MGHQICVPANASVTWIDEWLRLVYSWCLVQAKMLVFQFWFHPKLMNMMVSLNYSITNAPYFVPDYSIIFNRKFLFVSRCFMLYALGNVCVCKLKASAIPFWIIPLECECPRTSKVTWIELLCRWALPSLQRLHSLTVEIILLPIGHWSNETLHSVVFRISSSWRCVVINLFLALIPLSFLVLPWTMWLTKK